MSVLWDDSKTDQIKEIKEWRKFEKTQRIPVLWDGPKTTTPTDTTEPKKEEN